MFVEIECKWSVRNGKIEKPSTNIRFLGHSLKIPLAAGMNDYIGSIRKTLTDLDRKINESSSEWKFCGTNAESPKCRNVEQNAFTLNAMATQILQNLRIENERLSQKIRGSDDVMCLSCARSALNRILFGFLPAYWFQFGLSFGGTYFFFLWRIL